jgi:hypothetical protein
MNYRCLREPGKGLSASNDRALNDAPGGRNYSHFTLGFNRMEDRRQRSGRGPAGSFQTMTDNSISARRFDMRL